MADVITEQPHVTLVTAAAEPAVTVVLERVDVAIIPQPDASVVLVESPYTVAVVAHPPPAVTLVQEAVAVTLVVEQPVTTLVTSVAPGAGGGPAGPHDHAGDYAPLAHTHPYAPLGHDHDADYEPLGAADITVGVHEARADPHPQYLQPGAANALYSSLDHAHDADYAGLNHTHAADYAALDHAHDATYAALAHQHDADYAALDHQHAADYDPLGSAVAQRAAHESAPDPHPQYVTHAAAAAAYEVSGAVAAHAAAADPHPAYLDQPDADALYAVIDHDHAAAYASLGHNHHADYSPIGHDHAADYSSLSHDHADDYAPLSHHHDAAYDPIGAAAMAVIAHEAATNPHPDYLEQIEADALYSSLTHHHDAAYAASDHQHDAAYAALGHDHAADYDPLGTAAAAVATHTGLADPHAQYLEQADADALYAALGHDHAADYAGIGHDHDAAYDPLGAAVGERAAHEAAADPHPDYVRHSEADAAYAALSHHHDGVYDPIGSATAARNAHEADADPHPGYLTGEEGDAAYAPLGHNHTSAPGDGGPLTNDEHDGYVELADIAEPAPAPTTASLRIYAVSQNGYSVFEGVGDTGRTRRFARDGFIVARCKEAGGVTAGQVVYISGAAGANEEFMLARADSDATMPAAGVVLDAASNNGFARVLFAGKESGLDTGAFNEGDTLYVSPTVAGAMTATKPVWPDIIQRVAVVTRAHGNQGEVLVNPPGQAFSQPDHGSLANAGVNGHAVIDAHLAAAAPHSGHASSTHAAAHRLGGADEIKLDDLATPDDNTDLDATPAVHGLMSRADKVKLDGISGSGAADLGSYVAAESMTAPCLVHITAAGQIQYANATDTLQPADGFILANVAAAGSQTVYGPGQKITGLSSLTPGSDLYLSTTDGALINSTSGLVNGNVQQLVARALSATTAVFIRGPAWELVT